jgi:hypothetical protein
MPNFADNFLCIFLNIWNMAFSQYGPINGENVFTISGSLKKHSTYPRAEKWSDC